MRSKQSRAIMVFTVALLIVPMVAAQVPVTRYVSHRTNGMMPNGQSWPRAYHSLQQALADPLLIPGSEIWVAASDTPYKPEVAYPDPNSTDVRYFTFRIPPGVKVLGGFVGYRETADPNHPDTGETLVTQRNPEVNITVLDGDLGNNDVDSAFPDGGTYNDNAYHVVTFSNAPTTTKLSGFVVRHGYASDYQTLYDINDPSGPIAYDGSGGGILLRWTPEGITEPVIDRLVLKNNYAAVRGGGIAMNGKAEPHIANCEFRGNVVGGYNDTQFNNSVSGGGGLSNIGPHCIGCSSTSPGVLYLQNCIFFKNTAIARIDQAGITGVGGAVAGEATIVNCTFARNVAGNVVSAIVTRGAACRVEKIDVSAGATGVAHK